MFFLQVFLKVSFVHFVFQAPVIAHIFQPRPVTEYADPTVIDKGNYLLHLFDSATNPKFISMKEKGTTLRRFLNNADKNINQILTIEELMEQPLNSDFVERYTELKNQKPNFKPLRTQKVLVEDDKTGKKYYYSVQKLSEIAAMLARFVSFYYIDDKDLITPFNLYVATPNWSEFDERIFNAFFCIEIKGKVEVKETLILNNGNISWRTTRNSTTIICSKRRKNGSKCVTTNLGIGLKGMFHSKPKNKHFHS